MPVGNLFETRARPRSRAAIRRLRVNSSSCSTDSQPNSRAIKRGPIRIKIRSRTGEVWRRRRARSSRRRRGAAPSLGTAARCPLRKRTVKRTFSKGGRSRAPARRRVGTPRGGLNPDRSRRSRDVPSQVIQVLGRGVAAFRSKVHYPGAARTTRPRAGAGSARYMTCAQGDGGFRSRY